MTLVAILGIGLAESCAPSWADSVNTRAENCSIAAGRDASGNTITCNYGLTPDEMKELTRAAVAGATEPLLSRIESLSKRLGVSEEATKTLLKIVGEQPNVPDEDLTKALTRVAINYKNLQAQVASINADNPLSRALVGQIQAEIVAGRLQNAGELLQKITRRITTLNGTCTKAQAMGIAIDPKICLPQIMNTEYRDDRNGFTFVTQRENGSAIVSFSGYGPDQIHIDSDSVMQPIDKVVFTFQGSSDHLKAQGSCTFTNPYKGTPSTVSCAARTNEGTFAGEFVSDGVSPNLFEAGAGVPEKRSTWNEPQVLKGVCEAISHVAEGSIGEDLTRKQSRFFCDSVVIASFSDDPRHRLIQFASSQSNHGLILGFSGLMQDAAIMTVHSAYLETGRSLAATDGRCQLFMNGQELSGIACGAKIDQGGRRTVLIVSFAVDAASKTTEQK